MERLYSIDNHGLEIQVMKSGEWMGLELADLLNDSAREMLRQTAFRFVLYGQLAEPGQFLHKIEPE